MASENFTLPIVAHNRERGAAQWIEYVVCRGGKPEPLTEAELARLHTSFAERAELRFGPPQEDLALIHESSLYNEYRWRRSVTWGGRDWQELRFYVSADLVKLNLPNDQGVTEDGFVVRADGQLSHMVRWNRQVRRELRETLILELLWRPI